MNKNFLWDGGGTGRMISILLLVAGVSVGWWAYQGRQDSLSRAAQLERLKEKAWSGAMETSEALQAALLDARNDAARKRARDAQGNFAGAIDLLQTEFPDNSDLVSKARSLLDSHARILQQVDADLSAATAAYHRNYPGMQQDRADFLKNLDQQVAVRSEQALAGVRSRDFFALMGIGLILAVEAMLIWLQAGLTAGRLRIAAGALDRIRRGDFSSRAEFNGDPSFAAVGDGLNRLAENLSARFGQVQKSGLQLGASATRLAATAREQQSATGGIAAATGGAAATSRQISTVSRDLVKTMDDVSRAAEATAQLASGSQPSLSGMEAHLQQLLDATGGIAAKLSALRDRTAEITSVVTAITKVADQTNLLSLNAAIEAEKAGEYGLGFAVVAMEIRRLADQTAVATYDIEKTIKEMQAAVAASVTGMDRFSEAVRSSVGEIREVTTRGSQIIQNVQTLASRVQQVHQGVNAQASGAEQISQTLASLSESARQTAESVRQSTLVIEQLDGAIRALQAGAAPAAEN